MQTAEVLARLDGVKPAGEGKWLARCPSHDDHRQSLSIREGEDGKTLVNCFAGCAYPDIMAALDLQASDGFEDDRAGGNGRGDRGRDYPPPWDWQRSGMLAATYQYTDEQGRVLFEVLRSIDKHFCQRVPDPAAKGGHRYSLGDVRRALFHLPRVLEAAKAGRPIIVVEGEKDVLTLERHGFPATTWPGGASLNMGSKWRPEYSETLRGARVVLCGDHDDAGRAAMRFIGAQLQGVASEARLLELPGLDNKGDVSDWFQRTGNTPDLFRGLMESAPAFEPPAPDMAPTDRRREAVEAQAPEGPPEPSRAPLRFADLARWGREPAPAMEWLFQDRIHRGALVGLAAQGGSSKSFLLLEAAVSAATGKVLLPFLKPVAPLRVLALFSEDPEEEGWRRFRRICRRFRLTDADREAFEANARLAFCQPGPFMAGIPPRATAHFTELLAQVEAFGPDIVIIDPKSQHYGLDENSNDETTQWYSNLRRLCEAAPCAVIVSMHVSKAKQGDLDSGASRGASANRDDARVFYSMGPLDATLKDSERQKAYPFVTNPHMFTLLRQTKGNYVAAMARDVLLQRETDAPDTPEDLTKGGVLVEVIDVEERKRDAQAGAQAHLVRAVAELVEGNPSRLTVREISRPTDIKEEGRRAMAQDLRDALNERMKRSVSREECEEAFTQAERRGLVRIEQERAGGVKPRQVPVSVMGAFNPDPEEDEVPF